MLKAYPLKSLFSFMLCINLSFLLTCTAAEETGTQKTQTSSQPASQLSKNSEPQLGKQKVNQQGRIAPPEWIKCPRNNLTVFKGKAVSLERENNRILLRVETDEATKEEFAIPYSENDKKIEKFRLRGKPFEQRDWELIKSADDQIRPGVRAIVWACYESNNDLVVEAVDWQPPNQDERKP